MEIYINYHGTTQLKKFNQGDWIDLRSAEDVYLNQGDDRIISLGVSMKLPPGYEAHVAPRSGTFKNWGIMQANGFGVIDNSYSGDDDIWKFHAIAMRDTHIAVGDRICQFRIMSKQPELELIPVDHLEGESRGGFGSTGKS